MSALLTRARRTARLSWPARPIRKQHAILGPRNTWTAAGKRFRIIQFPHATARFQAVDDVTGAHIGNFGSLNGAKLACERAQREQSQ